MGGWEIVGGAGRCVCVDGWPGGPQGIKGTQHGRWPCLRAFPPCRNSALSAYLASPLLSSSGVLIFLTLPPLPALSHTFRYGVDPYVVHATFQRYPTDLHRQGKRARFRCGRGQVRSMPITTS